MKMARFNVFALSFILAVSLGSTVQADIQELVKVFNANGGVQMTFDRGENGELGRTQTHYLGMSGTDAGRYLSSYGQNVQGRAVGTNETVYELYSQVGDLRQTSESGATYFGSFCVERSGTTNGGDNIVVVGQLNLTEVANGVFNTMISTAGSSGVGSTPLTMGAALLYRDFILSGTDASPMIMEPWCSDPSSSWFKSENGVRNVYDERFNEKGQDRFSLFGIYDVQEAIWALQAAMFATEGQSFVDAMMSGNNVYGPIYEHLMDYFETHYTDYTETYGDEWWFGAYDPTNDFLGNQSVLVLNMTYENGNGFQDHIILIDREDANSNDSTPEPATLAVLGLGLPAAFWAVRRRRLQA